MSLGAAPQHPITRAQTAAYGVSAYGKGLLGATQSFVWLFFLTDVLEIPAAVAGLIVLLPLVWDGIADPVIAFLADRTRTRWGKYLPYLWFGAPVAACFFVLTFVKPPFGLAGTIAYAFTACLLFRTAFSCIEVPYNALMAMGTRDSRTRATLAGAKVLFNGLAGITIALAIAPVLKGGDAAAEADRFLGAAIIGALVAVPLIYLTPIAFRRVDRPHDRAAPRPPKIGFGDYAGLLRGSAAIYIVLGVWIVTMMTLPMFSKSLIYFSKYHLRDEAWASSALLAMTVGQTLAAPLFSWLAQHIEKARLVQVGQAVSAVVLATLLLTPSTDRTFLGALVFVEGMAIGGSLAVALSMVPDLVEDGEWRSGKRLEAGVFGLFTLANTIGQAVGAGLFGLLLGAVGFVANTVQTPGTLSGMRLIMTVVPLAGGVLAVAFLAFYRLDYREHRRLGEALAARQGAGG